MMPAGNDRRPRKGNRAGKGAEDKNADGGDRRSIDQAVVKALSHPVRVEILDLLCREGEMSPKRISVSLGHPLSAVAYHVKVLSVECELLELVKEVPRRGATEHFYRSKLEAGEPRIASFHSSITSLLDAARRGSIGEGK